MLSVRIQGQKYRIGNETLDGLVGAENWRRMDSGLLQKRIQDEYLAGRLIETQGHRLRLATTAEEAERRIRSEQDPGEILRWGLLHIASQVAEVADQLRDLHDTLQIDTDAATASLSRDTSHLTGDHPGLQAEGSQSTA
jgi:hypothetical protein